MILGFFLLFALCPYLNLKIIYISSSKRFIIPFIAYGARKRNIIRTTEKIMYAIVWLPY
jgi:hypothetical protein